MGYWYYVVMYKLYTRTVSRLTMDSFTNIIAPAIDTQKMHTNNDFWSKLWSRKGTSLLARWMKWETANGEMKEVKKNCRMVRYHWYFRIKWGICIEYLLHYWMDPSSVSYVAQSWKRMCVGYMFPLLDQVNIGKICEEIEVWSRISENYSYR